MADRPVVRPRARSGSRGWCEIKKGRAPTSPRASSSRSRSGATATSSTCVAREAFIRRSVAAVTVLRLLQPLAHAHAGDPARGVQRQDRPGRLGRQPARAGRRLRRAARPARRARDRRRHAGRVRGRQRPRGRAAVARLARLLGGLVLRRRRGQPPHAVHRALARTCRARSDSDEIMHVTDWFTTILRAAGQASRAIA